MENCQVTVLSRAFMSESKVRVPPNFHVIRMSWVDVAKNKSDPNFFASL